jgi:hypothetical protein
MNGGRALGLRGGASLNSRAGDSRRLVARRCGLARFDATRGGPAIRGPLRFAGLGYGLFAVHQLAPELYPSS